MSSSRDSPFLVLKPDLRTAVFAEEGPVARFECHRSSLTIGQHLAVTDGEDAALSRLLTHRVLDEDAAGRVLPGVVSFQQHPVMEGMNVHGVCLQLLQDRATGGPTPRTVADENRSLEAGKAISRPPNHRARSVRGDDPSEVSALFSLQQGMSTPDRKDPRRQARTGAFTHTSGGSRRYIHRPGSFGQGHRKSDGRFSRDGSSIRLGSR